jgi:outer membrane protein OmpA-like peptidoglycan-associated protein
MRIAPLLLSLAALFTAPGALAGPPGSDPAPAPAKGKLEITIDRSKVDLVNHKLEVKLSHAAEKVKLKVVGESGAVLTDSETPFGGAAAGTALVVTWQPSSAEAVARIEVWGHDTDGFYVGVAILPWNVQIPHEEVAFQTDSDVIRPAEVPKLEKSLELLRDAVSKHKDLGTISLFIAGHTDTVGSPEYNLTLSRKRARAIAAWFKGSGLTVRIAFEGLGESAPLVKTADEVDEPRNRRVDYILALEPPKLPSGPATFGWKAL